MTSTNGAQNLAAALDAVATVVDGVPDDQWSAPTPCTDWSVRQLTDHLVSGNRLFAAIQNTAASLAVGPILTDAEAVVVTLRRSGLGGHVSVFHATDVRLASTGETLASRQTPTDLTLDFPG